jgi:U3 small nucleolar RNA-associated protein 10
MVSSLKSAHADRLALYIGSRDFLRIFTEAANHIPRHRRTKSVKLYHIFTLSHCIPSFFAHLVDVLGPEDFLAPVLMLLLEKVASRVIRQTSEDLQGSLGLQISILQHYAIPMQLFVCNQRLEMAPSPT